MTTSSKLSILVGMAALMTPMSAIAWERTTETKVAANGTPLVKMIAEPNDMLGEPWLEYLTTIGYDVSGDWWVKTAQSLLNFNPNGRFVRGTSYGIAEGSQWWLPDMKAIKVEAENQPTASADENPLMRQSDFIALGEAFADDLAKIRVFQQESEAKLAQRLDELEAAQVTATKQRADLRTDLEAVATTQANLTEATKEGGTIDQRVDSKLTKVTTEVESLRLNLDSNTVAIKTAANQRQALSDAQATAATQQAGLRTDLAGVVATQANLTEAIKEGGTIDQRFKKGQSFLMIVGGIVALVLLLLLGVTTKLILRRIGQTDTKVRSDFAQANVKLDDKFTGETKRLKGRLDTVANETKLLNGRLDTVADVAIPGSFDRAALDPAKLGKMPPGDSFTLTIQSKESSQQWRTEIERVVYDGGNGPEERVIIHGLSRRDDQFVQMQPVTLKSAIAKVEEGIVKDRFRDKTILSIAAE